MRIPEKSSVRFMIDYADGVIAGMLAVSKLEEPTAELGWETFLARLEDTETTQRKDDRAWQRASARVDVRDERWDTALVAASGETYHVSGKDAGKAPYSLLFKNIPARTATRFGGDRATTYGIDLLSKAAAIDNAALKASFSTFATANDDLRQAVTARNEARSIVRLHEIRRSELLDELQHLVDHTEVKILEQFPGNKELVTAILGLKRDQRRDEAPATGDPAPEPPAPPS